MVVDAFLVYHFIKRLVTPFEKMKAFELGLIDKNGNFLKKRRNFNQEERKALQMFDVMIINLKRLIAKVPGGKTRIGTIAAALYLLRSTPSGRVNEEIMLEDMIVNESKFFEIVKEVESILEDNPPINSTTGIAGLTPDTLGIPVKAANKYKKKNIEQAKKMLALLKRK